MMHNIPDLNIKTCLPIYGIVELQVQYENNCNKNTGGITTTEIESDMQELVQLVFCNSPDSLDPEFKQIFFMVARTFYYTAYCNLNTIESHINKVMFGTGM